MTATKKSQTHVTVRIELFGNARLLAGRCYMSVRLTGNCGLGDVAEAVARDCPALVGTVVRKDLRGFLDSYTVNLNGVTFVGDGLRQRLNDGDSLLVFSSQAGG